MPRNALTGSRIRDRRTAKGLKQADLARQVGISPSYLNLIEHNRRRIGGKLLIDLSRVLEVEATQLTEGAEAALLTRMRQAAADTAKTGAEEDRADEFAGRFPGWAGLVAAQHDRIAQLERTVETLTDRLTHDPFLSTSLYDVVSSVTSIRSTSSILAGEEDLDDEWQSRFLQNLDNDSRRLAESSQALVAYLDGVGDAQGGATSPQEELEGYLLRNGYHLPTLEDGSATPQDLVADAALASEPAQILALAYFTRYEADALQLPLEGFLERFGTTPDPAALAQSYRTDIATILRRIATMPDEGAEQRIGLVTCDASGTLTFRKESPGFSIPKFGAACPLWPLYQALIRPHTPVEAVVEQASRTAPLFRCYAIAQPLRPASFHGPDVIEATMLIIPLEGAHELAAGAKAQPIGSSCRICPREACIARREPSILADGF
ncbi:helix-turn-helix transcriptional regulator [Cognatishimia sp. MH4019]|uniref:helix-turn-helix transcriptional regulator n=1 Tax=Cognatishimia sp. MH4019 TaxID=2854030 RepID=UPI001CD4EEDD|nr:helix-turn-helix transcriptional regulator [Cognatishimia sp. MH4019]